MPPGACRRNDGQRDRSGCGALPGSPERGVSLFRRRTRRHLGAGEQSGEFDLAAEPGLRQHGLELVAHGFAGDSEGDGDRLDGSSFADAAGDPRDGRRQVDQALQSVA